MDHQEMDPRPETEIPSLPKRILQLFFAPTQLFDALREKPVWGGALLVTALFVGGSMGLIPTEVWDSWWDEAMVAGGFDPEEIDLPGEATRIIMMVTVFLGSLIGTLIVAAVMKLVFGMLMRGDGSYRHYLSVVSHAAILGGVGYLVATPFRIAAGDPLMPLGVGALTPFIPEGFTLRFLQGMDLFGLWATVLSAIGVTRIDRERSFAAALAVLLGLQVLGALWGASAGGIEAAGTLE